MTMRATGRFNPMDLRLQRRMARSIAQRDLRNEIAKVIDAIAETAAFVGCQVNYVVQ